MCRVLHIITLLCLFFAGNAKAVQAFSADDAYQCVIGSLAEAKKRNRPLQEIVNESVNRMSLAKASAWRAWGKKWDELSEPERNRVLGVVDEWLISTDALEDIDEDSVVVSPRIIPKTGYYEVSGHFTVRGMKQTFVLFLAQSQRGCEVIELEWQNARLSQGIASGL